MQTGDKLAKNVTRALTAIDEVHSDGKLPPVSVTPITSGRNLGEFRRYMDGTVEGIKIRASGPWPELTTAHELGHLLDWAAIGPSSAFGSEAKEGPLAGVMAAIGKSDAMATLKSAAEKVLEPKMRKHIEEYLLSSRELWARAYAQYVATRSKNPEMKEQLVRAQAAQAGRQWATEDFAPIAAEIDKAFKGMGWL